MEGVHRDRRRARIRHIGGVGTIKRHDAVDVGLRQTGEIEIGGRVHHRGIVVEVTQSNRMPDLVGRDEGQFRAAQIVGAIEPSEKSMSETAVDETCSN